MIMRRSESEKCAICSTESVYVARQPVFGPDMGIWGYELLFRQSGQATTAYIEDGNVATSQVITDGFGLATEWLSTDQKVLINYPAEMLLQGAPMALPSAVAVVEILETVRPDPEILDMCRRLKNDGYILALDDFVGDPGFEPLLELADLVKVDVLNMPPDRIRQVAAGLRHYPCTLLAEKVENLEILDVCRASGFGLFQGFFFSRPQIVAGKKLSSNQISKLKVLQELGTGDPDPARLAKIIQSDVSLSYRLLRYINSPSVGLRNEITSIGQAVNLMGQRRIAAWLRVLVLADMNTLPQARELLFFSVQRARFLELLAGLKTRAPLGPETMFLLGLFSSLDALLSQPMADIVAQLPLEPRLAKALLGQDPELQSWLNLALASEAGKWAETEHAIGALAVEPCRAASIMNRATVWAKRFLEAA